MLEISRKVNRVMEYSVCVSHSSTDRSGGLLYLFEFLTKAIGPNLNNEIGGFVSIYIPGVCKRYLFNFFIQLLLCNLHVGLYIKTKV